MKKVKTFQLKDTVILVGKNGKESAMKFILKMNEDVSLCMKYYRKNGSFFWRVYDSKMNTFASTEKLELGGKKVIRFGTQAETLGTPRITYNTIPSLKSASNKLSARQKFLENELPIPNTFKTPSEPSFEDFPLIARPFSHKQGQDLFFLRDIEDLADFLLKNKGNAFYYSSFIDKTNEYRVHVGSGKVLSVLEKPKPITEGQVAWNLSLNEEDEWKVLNRNNCDRRLMKLAIKAVNSLGMDYGSVDVIALKSGKNTYKFFVLEVNSCPDLRNTEYNSNKFAKLFDLYASNETKVEFIDETENYQLRNDYFQKFN